MIWIILIKIILVIFSILTVGILPLVAILNMWVWNEIIVQHVLTSAIPITSFWIILGLTAIGSIPVPAILKLFKSKDK